MHAIYMCLYNPAQYIIYVFVSIIRLSLCTIYIANVAALCLNKINAKHLITICTLYLRFLGGGSHELTRSCCGFVFVFIARVSVNQN